MTKFLARIIWNKIYYIFFRENICVSKKDFTNLFYSSFDFCFKYKKKVYFLVFSINHFFTWNDFWSIVVREKIIQIVLEFNFHAIVLFSTSSSANNPRQSWFALSLLATTWLFTQRLTHYYSRIAIHDVPLTPTTCLLPRLREIPVNRWKMRHIWIYVST